MIFNDSASLPLQQILKKSYDNDDNVDDTK